jgi:hypothetical protein
MARPADAKPAVSRCECRIACKRFGLNEHRSSPEGPLLISFSRPALAARRMARPAGLEPATLGLEGRCSIQLSYGRFNLASIKRDYLSLQTSTRPCDASASLPQSAAKFAFVPETTQVIVAPIKAEQRPRSSNCHYLIRFEVLADPRFLGMIDCQSSKAIQEKHHVY